MTHSRPIRVNKCHSKILTKTTGREVSIFYWSYKMEDDLAIIIVIPIRE